MRFIDETELRVVSGAGGDGTSSFRREAFVPYGGPDGGDGGKGGDVVLVTETGLNTLLGLRTRPLWKAEDGSRGRGANQTGASGEDLVIPVPVGTQAYDAETGELLADLTGVGQRWIAAKGGAGGKGNTRFKTSTNRTPHQWTPGGPAEERLLRLELRLMADVGLLGFPNAGKSTLIGRISAARPRVADYPFTTLTPSLGVVSRGDDAAFVVADIPGLIRGASHGAGLGHQFLRHLLRNRLLLHLVSLAEADAWAGEGEGEAAETPVERYRALRAELGAYDEALAALPEIIVLTKADAATAEDVAAARAALATEAPDREIFVVSAVTGQGLGALIDRVWVRLRGMLTA